MTLKTICRWIFCILFVCLSSVFFASCSSKTVEEEIEEYDDSLIGTWITQYYSRNTIFCFKDDGTGYQRSLFQGRPDGFLRFKYVDYGNYMSIFKYEGEMTATSSILDGIYQIKNNSLLFEALFTRYNPEKYKYSLVPYMELSVETSLGKVSSITKDDVQVVRGEKIKLNSKIYSPGNKYEILDSYLVVKSSVEGVSDTINVTNLMNKDGEFSYEYSTFPFMGAEHKFCSCSLFTTYKLVGPIYLDLHDPKEFPREFVLKDDFPVVNFKQD